MGNRVVLGRIKSSWPFIGDCGAVRDDKLFPIGETTNEKDFMIDALKFLKRYKDTKEEILLEYFYGEPGLEWKEDENFIFRIERENDFWRYSTQDTPQGQTFSTEELINDFNKRV